MTFHPGEGNSQKRKKASLSHEAWGGFDSNAVSEPAKQCIKTGGVASASLDISNVSAQRSGAGQSIAGVSSILVSDMAETSWQNEYAGSTSALEESAGTCSPAKERCAASQQRAQPYQARVDSNADTAASAARRSGAASASARLAASSGSDMSAAQMLDLLLGRDGDETALSSVVLPSSKTMTAQASSALLAALMQPSAKVTASQQCSEVTPTALPVVKSKAKAVLFHCNSLDATRICKCSVSRNEQGQGQGSGEGHASSSQKFLALLAGE